jgi:hypothetical protein
MEHDHGHTNGPRHGHAHGPRHGHAQGETHGHHPGHAHGDAHGVHGMLVLGGQKTDDAFRSPVYVSHLPMFMKPHDFQVIARVTGEAAGTYGDFVAHFGSDPIYTFNPEPFSIDELDAPHGGRPARTSFRGTLFRGHFERGGSAIRDHTSFEVEQMVHFRRFGADAARDQLRYLCFGQRDAAFLAHLITAPPDFDQILSVELGALSGVSEDDLRAGVIVTVPDRQDDVGSRLQEGEAFSGGVQAEESGTSGSIELTVTSEYYLETGDLAEAM